MLTVWKSMLLDMCVLFALMCSVKLSCIHSKTLNLFIIVPVDFNNTVFDWWSTIW